MQRLGINLGTKPQEQALQRGPALGNPGQRIIAQAIAEGSVQRLKLRAVQRQRAQHATSPTGTKLGTQKIQCPIMLGIATLLLSVGGTLVMMCCNSRRWSHHSISVNTLEALTMGFSPQPKADMHNSGTRE